jgi:hypothetical protein
MDFNAGNIQNRGKCSNAGITSPVPAIPTWGTFARSATIPKSLVGKRRLMAQAIIVDDEKQAAALGHFVQYLWTGKSFGRHDARNRVPQGRRHQRSGTQQGRGQLVGSRITATSQATPTASDRVRLSLPVHLEDN